MYPKRRTSRLSSTCSWAALAALALAACVAGPSARATAGQEPDTPEEITDLLAVSGAGETTVYVADSKKGAIYSYTLTAKDGSGVSLDKFRKFHASRNIAEPSALAYSDGKLLVCENDSHAVYEIDLRSAAADRGEKVLVRRGES